MKKLEAFISLKDHKENFENNPKCRLINPAKSDSGTISKLILDKVNTHLRTILNVNQWRNTQNAIEWFGNIEQKSMHSFISFDVVYFYPSISENLLDQALSWASSLADISHEDISIIKHTRKSHKSNFHVVNFLDVTFDLSTGKYKPYRKPNDDPLYINKHSNHPPSILRQLPTSINAFQHFHLTSKHLRTQHQHIRTH